MWFDQNKLKGSSQVDCGNTVLDIAGKFNILAKTNKTNEEASSDLVAELNEK